MGGRGLCWRTAVGGVYSLSEAPVQFSNKTAVKAQMKSLQAHVVIVPGVFFLARLDRSTDDYLSIWGCTVPTWGWGVPSWDWLLLTWGGQYPSERDQYTPEQGATPGMGLKN
ncbi:hypothetical protein MHYP_G00263060 [Metynnis hypsauchen]